MHTHVYTHTRTHTRTTHTHTHTRMHARTHVLHTHARTHTHTHYIRILYIIVDYIHDYILFSINDALSVLHMLTFHSRVSSTKSSQENNPSHCCYHCTQDGTLCAAEKHRERDRCHRIACVHTYLLYYCIYLLYYCIYLRM